ncbi:concanavalin A-like lectin/glucanase [Saitoella complicata NRRL Y-17804]|nr:concanavalin A-like lectin/glucanase [Saitoella complicata NRRL Y-17804]ODQ49727.1 concanavalin A-like lectin/glucanase [Saitoella complicata NRRL Y-17804]
MTEWDKETKSNNRIIEALPWAGIVLGSALCGFLAWYGWQSVPTNTYNLVLDESFANGIQNSTWNYEIQLGGFGNGEFDMTTNSAQNAYVDDNNLLHIVPTLSSDTYGADAITNGYTLNLTTAGICTSDQTDKCAITSNSSTGTILPPIRSARLTTKGKHGIEYGKVEVVAKIPKGDWMWPAIWMMPTNDTYGPWPASGEMDIMEARGNTPGVGVEGRDYVSSTLQWGPSSAYNRYWKTSSVVRMQHGDYSDRFHTFGLEWTPEYVFAYVDSRLRQGMSVRFSKSFYERGQFPRSDWQNNTVILDPWTGTDALPDASNATPFDQEFYLILNVAVGGTNGYFPDTMKGKPWVDATATARRDFWSARDEWYKTWPAEEERGMIVKSVKMYQLVEAGKRYI